MFFVIATIAIIPLLKLIDTHIYIQIQALQAYIAPPIVSVFLLGIFWKKASSNGAIWALIIGGLLGLSKIGLASIDNSWFENILFLQQFNDINYLHFAIFLFLTSSIIIIGISVLDMQKNKNYATRNENLEEISEKVGAISTSPTNNQISETEVKLSKTKSEVIH
jgi:Na+/proline symporter